MRKFTIRSCCQKARHTMLNNFFLNPITNPAVVGRIGNLTYVHGGAL